MYDREKYEYTLSNENNGVFSLARALDFAGSESSFVMQNFQQTPFTPIRSFNYVITTSRFRFKIYIRGRQTM